MKGNQTIKKKGITMNPMTHFKKIRILLLLIAPALVALTAVPARATPACNFSGTQLAMGTFPEGLLDLMCKDLPDWNLRFKVKGDTDVYIFQNTWQPLGHTGWHTHPGPSLLFVISGQITAYDASDSTCTPTTYSAGQVLTDIGCGDVHLVANESATNTAVVIAVQFIPHGQPRRIDEPAPSNCPVITCPF